MKSSLKDPTSLETGLLSSQLEGRPVNILPKDGKSVKTIVFEHVFSYFNLVNFILAALVIYTGSFRNLLFMIVVISNTAIGLYQELRSRKVLQNLALVNQQHYTVLRNSRKIQLNMDQIVLGDIIYLKAGNQIPCDGIIRSGDCQVNESLITGESRLLDKTEEDMLSAGCYLSSGSCIIQATKVGSQTLMASILKDAKRSEAYPSQLRDSLDTILRFSSWILFPVGILLFLSLYFRFGNSLNEAILSVVAAMVGMIPEGLIILTSIALAASSIKLAREKVLIQELYCIENLARVDVLCLDKTGTITSGNMEVENVIELNGTPPMEFMQSLTNLYAALGEDNATASAICRFTQFNHVTKKPDKLFPFQSDAKCSGAVFEDETLIAGAATFVLENPSPALLRQIDGYAKKGLRVLVLARGPVMETLKKGDYEVLGLILLDDEIRPDAKQTIDYFKQQDVEVKVISGDMLATVQTIARKAGIDGKGIDMSLVSKDEIPQVMEEYSVFARVTPMQKKEMIAALQANGHTAAMIGDGVNDVMALKQADCSIAMESGSQAARSVAALVLLENQFDALPSIVLEGRRVINNIQTTASLFLVKTIYSMMLSLLTTLWIGSYPFMPIQLTLVSSLGIGIPAFILTFEPNYKRIQGNFLVNVLSRAIPGAMAFICGVIIADTLVTVGILDVSDDIFHSMCTLLAVLNAMVVLVHVCQPLNVWRKALVTFCAVGFAFCFIFLGKVFYLVIPDILDLIIVLAIAFIQYWIFILMSRLDWKSFLDRFSFLKTERKYKKRHILRRRPM